MVLHAELRKSRPAEQLMSMPALRQHRWTIEEVERLIDEREGLTPRYELADGELLVTPAPSGRHQRIVFALAILVHEYVKRHGLGEVRLGPSMVSLTRTSRFEPDLFVVPSRDGRLPLADEPVTRLVLAVEVLSPSSSRHDRITKRRFFQTHDVPEYWVVDGETEAFEVWRPSDERAALVDDHLVWRPDTTIPPFELDVRQFFADIADPPES